MDLRVLQEFANQLRDRGMASALEAESFTDLIRQTTRLYLEQSRYEFNHEPKIVLFGIKVEPFDRAKVIAGVEALGGTPLDIGTITRQSSVEVFFDVEDRPLILFESDWMRRRSGALLATPAHHESHPARRHRGPALLRPALRPAADALDARRGCVHRCGGGGLLPGNHRPAGDPGAGGSVGVGIFAVGAGKNPG